LTALTATATPAVRADVVKTLGIKNARSFVVTFNRPNIAIHVKSKKSLRDLCEFAKVRYCFSQIPDDCLHIQY
jgi:superfamily II DNA helicase RecQ